MSSPGFLKATCRHCDGHIEFPAEAMGREVPCPHCHQAIVLPVDDGAQASSGRAAPTDHPRRRALFFLLCFCVVAGGLMLGLWHILPFGRRLPSAMNPRSRTDTPEAYCPHLVIASVLGDAWGWSPRVHPVPAEELLDISGAAKWNRANLLLNVGPDESGQIPQDQLETLARFGELKARNP